MRQGKDHHFFFILVSMQLGGALKAVPEGVAVRVDVSSGSRHLGVSGFNPWRPSIFIKLTERARAGKANEQLVRYLAVLFNKPPDDVQLISGHRSTRKVVLLCNTTVNEVEAVINAALRR